MKIIKYIKCIHPHNHSVYSINTGIPGKIIKDNKDFVTIIVNNSFAYNLDKSYFNIYWKTNIFKELSLRGVKVGHICKLENLELKYKIAIEKYIKFRKIPITCQEYAEKIERHIDKFAMDSALS